MNFYWGGGSVSEVKEPIQDPGAGGALWFGCNSLVELNLQETSGSLKSVCSGGGGSNTSSIKQFTAKNKHFHSADAKQLLLRRLSTQMRGLGGTRRPLTLLLPAPFDSCSAEPPVTAGVASCLHGF